MRVRRFLIVVMLLQGLIVSAQTNDRMIVHAGDSLSKYHAFLFPSFGDATVKMRDGRSVVYKMNFNLLLCDMQFINPKGDTVVITNAVDIDSIRLDSCLFIYDYQKGYYQLLAVSDRVSLAIYRHTTFRPVPKGAFGSNASTGGVEMINSVSNRGGTIPLVLNEDMYVLESTIFILYYKGGGVDKAGKAAFMRIYNGDKKSFDQFIKTNKIDFDKQGDLEKLFQFCIQSKM